MIRNKRGWAVGAETPQAVPRTKPTEVVMDYNTRNRKPPDLSKHYVTRGGEKFLRFKGYLEMANYMGMTSIRTEMVTCLLDQEAPVVIFKCTITMHDGRVFDAHGDATLNNVGQMVKQHFIRMAETRAMVRALRWATGIYETALEELGGEEPTQKIGSVTQVSGRAKTGGEL